MWLSRIFRAFWPTGVSNHQTCMPEHSGCFWNVKRLNGETSPLKKKQHYFIFRNLQSENCWFKLMIYFLNVCFLFTLDIGRIRSWFSVDKAKDLLAAKPYQQQYLAKACCEGEGSRWHSCLFVQDCQLKCILQRIMTYLRF